MPFFAYKTRFFVHNRSMIKAGENLNDVKRKVNSLLGYKVAVKVNLGRNKYERFLGQVTAVYPSLFRISPLGDYKGKTTYSFQEMLCGTVFLKKAEQ